MRDSISAAVAAVLTIMGLAVSPTAAADELETLPQPSYGYAVFGELRYPPDFTHYDFANPDAPKGGTLHMGINGSFDSLNDLVVKGTAAAGLARIYDPLMSYTADELGAAYPMIAETITVAPDYSWVIYHLDPRARFHDGVQIKPEDVIFSYEVLMAHASPVWIGFLNEVKEAKITGPRSVKFSFKHPNRQKAPYLMGGLRIYPKHFWKDRDFEAANMDIPLGNSAYRIKSVDQGHSIVYERVKDYWAKDLPTKRGQQNFDTIVYDYYRDENSRFEAFKAGDLNHRTENNAPKWAKSYNFAAVESGDVVQTAIRTEDPAWILTWALNMRRGKFKDARVREAFAAAFDFDWLNKNFLFGLHDRTDSYFDNSSIGSSGLPSAKEIELLEPYRASVPPELFERPFENHSTDGSGNNRAGLVKAMKLLKEAGWEVRDGILTNASTGEVFTAELLVNNALMARVGSPWIAALKKLGVQAEIRQVDSAQYFNRISSFDYDMMVVFLPQQSMPTRELSDYWGSSAAKRNGSLNFAGIEDEAIDALIEIIVDSNDPEEYFAAIKAVDRILLWNHYMIPLYHTPESWRAHARQLKHKEPPHPMYDYGFPYSWWYEEDDLASLK